MNSDDTQEKPNIHGFEAKGKKYQVRVYRGLGILTYEVLQDGVVVIERRWPNEGESEKQLVERMMGMMGV